MHCPNCKKWEITDADVFCAWCRQILVDFSASLSVDHVCASDIAPDVSLTLTHIGTVGRLRVEKVESTEPWVKPHFEQIVDCNLPVGRDFVLPIEVDLSDLADDYHQARIIVSSSVGTRETVLEVTPRPKFRVTTDGEYTVLLDNIVDERMSGYLSVTRGVVTVESLSTDVPEWATVEAVHPATLPCKLDQREENRLEFLFHIDEQILLDEVKHGRQPLPAEFKGTLLVKLREFEEPRKETFRVKCFLPPRLDIPEADAGTIRLEVFAGKRGELDLTLQNGNPSQPGRADLHISDIRIDAGWLQLSGSISYPITVVSQEYYGLTLLADTKTLKEGVYPAKVTFLTNRPDEREKDIWLDMVVQRMPDFDGKLAIDFGTTNSCCAFLDSDGQVDLIPLGEPGDGVVTTVSSTILYQDLFETTKQYLIGNTAYVTSFDPPTAFSAVRQVKRHLGTNKIYDITFFRDPSKRATYNAREVTTDILKRILERAEEHLGARITSCTISHPSRFSVKQIESLKAALEECKIASVRTVHEPIGAAMSFIRQKEIREKYEQYHLMVFDFGGGTTDITLLSVRNEYQPAKQRTMITPEVLGTTGDRRLGGEDVTELVMQLVRDRCDFVLRKRYPEPRNFILPFDAERFSQPYRRRLAQENRNVLRRWSEAAKIAISDFGDDHKAIGSLHSSFQLAVIVDNEIRPVEVFSHAEVVPKKEQIEEKLRPKLEQAALMMRELIQPHEIQTPDIILLSGKSSALPIVREVIAKQFPHALITTPPDFKECVVRGACELSNPDPRAGIAFNLKKVGALSATTSWLGIRVNDDESGEPKFEKVIDAGMPIGPDGLRKAVPPYVELRRDVRITIMENTGLDPWLRQNGRQNENITVLKVFRLDASLAQWEQKHKKRISEEAFFDAEMELMVTPNLVVKLLAYIPGMNEPLEFETELSGW